MDSMLLDVTLGQKDMDNLLGRYHFQPSDSQKLQAMYEAVKPLLEVKAYYLWGVPELHVDLETYTAVFLTLGAGIDALQNVYLAGNHMSEAYMLECIGLELLSAAYEAYAAKMQLLSGKWAVKLHFIGDKYPFEYMDIIHRAMGEIDITYNDQYVMSPQKSVAFFLEMRQAEAGASPQDRTGLTEKRQQAAHTHKALCHVRLAHICGDCKNVDCEYRHKENYTYGYQRIFGGK